MITQSSAEIEAPASIVWDVFVDVEQWPSWTAPVTRIAALDGPGIEVGKQFKIKHLGWPPWCGR